MSNLHLTVASRRIALLAGCAFAVGALALSAAPAVAGCNSGNVGNTDLLTSANCLAAAAGSNATAVGASASASGGQSTAFGRSAFALKDYSTAVGYNAGAFSASAGMGSTAIGAGAGGTGTGIWSVAIGAGPLNDLGAHALGAGSIAIGAGESVDFRGARASGNAAVAIGNRSVAGGEGYGSAFGYNARADVGLAPTAVGTDSTAKGTNAAAFGRFSSAAAENSTALGSGAQATRKLAVAIGFGSIADAPNTVSVGAVGKKRRIVNVANAVANTDAATLGQVKAIATTAAIEALSNETIAKAVGETVSGDLQRELRQMRSMIERLQQEIAELKSQSTALAK